jgi:antitoxin YefM
MSEAASYTEFRANLAKYLDDVESTREAVIVKRRGHEDVAMIPATELASLIETAHLLRSPKNARRLLEALNRSRADEGEPHTLESLKREAGLEKA